MKITAITRYKHGELFEMLRRLGWSQRELSQRCNVSQTEIWRIVNLHERPSVKLANAIQKALGEAGEYIDVLESWPETFSGLKRGYKREQTQDIPLERLIDNPQILQIESSEPESLYREDMQDLLSEAIEELPERERAIISERYWNGKTLRETGKQFNIGPERIRQIEMKANRNLRGKLKQKKQLMENRSMSDRPLLS